jgi:hypothetical protein
VWLASRSKGSIEDVRLNVKRSVRVFEESSTKRGQEKRSRGFK